MLDGNSAAETEYQRRSDMTLEEERRYNIFLEEACTEAMLDLSSDVIADMHNDESVCVAWASLVDFKVKPFEQMTHKEVGERAQCLNTFLHAVEQYVKSCPAIQKQAEDRV